MLPAYRNAQLQIHHWLAGVVLSGSEPEQHGQLPLVVSRQSSLRLCCVTVVLGDMLGHTNVEWREGLDARLRNVR